MADNVQTVTITGHKSSFKVMITCDNDKVVFEASAPVTESRSVNYDGYNVVQMPTDLWAYRNTSARHFSVTGKLVSRTVDEANANSNYLDLIRSWSLPDFGESGATPPIVKLYAYLNNNIFGVPCIIRAYSWTFPDDVDYIYMADSPMPVIGILQVDLDEAYSAQQITNKAWKINRSDIQTATTTSTPPDIPNGIANTSSLNTFAAQNAFSGNPFDVVQTPTFASTLGITSSSSIIDSTPQLANPFTSGINTTTLQAQVAPQVVPPAPQSVVDPFNRTTTLTATPPITS
jgi:hypothetical protein